MPKFSTTIATVMLAFLVLEASHWDALPSSGRLWTGIASIYVILLAVTGWSYAVLEVKPLGWIHALLMLGIAGISGYFGYATLSNRSIAGGSGPDANPVAGIIYGFGFLYCMLAMVTTVCGVGVITHLLGKTNPSKPAA